MKYGIFALLFLLVTSVFADEERILKFSCDLNKSEALKIYVVNGDYGKEVKINVAHFLYGESEVYHLQHPMIVDYGGVFMAVENYGRSGYFFMRFEDRERNALNNFKNTYGVIDDNRFNTSTNLPLIQGKLTAINDCEKVVY